MQSTRALLRYGLIAALLVFVDASTARSEICLPPFLGGQPRLHHVGDARVSTLGLLLRQHEVCWRVPKTPDEKRIFAFGNSSIFGFPHAAEYSAVGVVNEYFEREGVPAHLYNLAFVFTYQMKDAVVLNEALRYDPDLIVYGITLDDLRSVAPMPYPGLVDFFDANVSAIDRLAKANPKTLDEPIHRYQELFQARSALESAWLGLRRFGTFMRIRAEDTAVAIRRRWFPERRDKPPAILGQSAIYDCQKTLEIFDAWFGKWGEWNLLEYLAELKRTRGIEVLVVNWPVNHEPRGDCYNARYPTAALEQYTRWLEEKTRSLDLPLVDLHDALENRDFVDSIHPTRAGQRKVAARLIGPLNQLLEARSNR